MADIDGAIAPAEAATDKPRPAVWWLGSFAVAGGLVVSALVHLALVGAVLFVTPKLLPAPVNSMTVDIVSPDEIAEISKKAAERPDPQQPTPPQPALAPPMAPQPQPQPQAQPPQAAQAPPSSALDPYLLPRDPPPTAAPVPELGEAARLAQLLGLPPPMAGAAAGGGPSEVKANLTPEEIARFSAHVQSCWTSPAGLVNAPKLEVVIRVGLRPDGRFTVVPALLAAPASAQGPALVKAAMRALQQCQPYNALPAGKYDEWRLLDLRFSADGMATVSPVRSEPRAPRQPG
jgi:type IV secretory pathway VirB10-like protein